MIEIIDLPYEMVISYYDVKIGPIVLTRFGIDIPEKGIDIPENQITNLMEFHTDGETFSHCYVQHDKLFSLNHCFAIKGNKARGGCHDLMISVLFKKKNNISIREYLNTILDNIELLELWIEGISEQIYEEKCINSILKSQKAGSLYNNDDIKRSLIGCLNRNSLYNII
ncbi:MAG: hypothetical protein ACFFAI_06445 [Promethearchaeota archaeon]